jgi:DNA segregation ATPase FtsK/SpoIIIE, S-DNA-T family
MSRIAWHRPARVHPPQLPDTRLAVAAPPQVPTNQSMSTWMTLLLPLMSSVSVAAYMLTYRKPLTTFLGIGVVVLSVGLTFGTRYQMRSTARRAKDKQRGRYAQHLAEVRRTSREVSAMQRAVATWQHPSPERLWALAAGRRRVWERRPDDADFLRLRLGTGRGALSTPIQLSARTDPTVEYEAESMADAERVAQAFGTVGHQPALVDVSRAGVVSLVGPPAATRAVGRALLLQLAVLHAPEDVTVAVCTSGNDADWRWTTWLPHTREAEHPDAEERPDTVPAPLVAADFAGLADVLERELARARAELGSRAGSMLSARPATVSRRLVLLVDDYDPASLWGRSALARQLIESAGPTLGITLVALVEAEAHEPSRVDVRVRVGADGALTLESRDPALRSQVEQAVADRPAPELCEAAARALAPLLVSDEEQQVLARTVSLSELLGTDDLATLDPTRFWVAPGEDDVLRVPVGTDADGNELVLDLKEAAQDGMGPHGLIVGATGSGKSELLRTLVTGLTMTHSPEQLSLVLVDFKGGATFAGFTGLPHVAGLITNLADDLALVDRVRDALIGEQQRRQQLLRDAGNVDSLREYQIRQAAGENDIHGRPLEPLPYLLLVVDEFGELLSARSDFINLFVQIGRVGRSLGIHLLLATQRLEEGRLRGLESHLSYRLCLRTFSAGESRAVIGTTDAYRLPSIPGSAYLKVDESVYTRFRVAHVSAPFDDGTAPLPEEQGERLEPVGLGLRRAPESPAEVADARRDARRFSARAAERPRAVAVVSGPTQMEVIVERIQQFGAAVHQVWLPPLPAAVSLDALLGTLAVQEDRGLQAVTWPLAGQLRFPVGVTDLPLRQQQQPLVLDFGQTHPHLALVGAPQSGKSTLLRTAMLSAMLTHTPDELQFACLDYGGGSLHGLARAPHVSAVAGRHEPDRARRVLNEARRLIDAREQLFREESVGSVADFRLTRTRGRLAPEVRAADLIVVVDNWGAVRAELEDADAIVLDIAGRGPGVGVHLLLAANRWGDVRMNLRDAISARLELRLNDSAESEVDRRLAKLVPAGIPGRGAVTPGHFYQAALPRTDGRDSAADLGDAQEAAVARIAASWTGRTAPQVRMLPERIHVTGLAVPDGTASGTGAGALVGVGERDLEPVRIDLTSGDPHLLVVGDAGAGKSTFLRTWMRGMADRYSPWEVRFMVVDYRRSLSGVVPAPYVGAYASDAKTAESYAQTLAGTLGERLPPADVTPRQLQDRSWWEGPDLYLVVDDYDLVGGGRTSPLQPLLDFAAQSREIGFHIVVARRSGGISRALMSDPMVSRIRELGASGLLLSSDPREGVLIGGRRGAELPPGRGVLVRRQEGHALVQIAVSDEDESAAGTTSGAAAGAANAPVPAREMAPEMAPEPA